MYFNCGGRDARLNYFGNLAVGCIQGSSGERGENDGRHHKSVRDDSRVDHDDHVQERAQAETREESKTKEQSQSHGPVLSVV